MFNVDESNLKQCSDCKEWKKLSEFNKDKKSKKDGRQKNCRACSRIYWSENSSHKYYVIFDPWNSFTKNSSYKRKEITEMLENKFLAAGTKFRRGKYEYEISEKMSLDRL